MFANNKNLKNSSKIYVDFEYYEELENINKQNIQEIKELKDEYNTKLLCNAGIYQLGFKDGENSIENKIKAKIEEVKDGIYDAKIVLQSLLEKE